jgi:hypothetical protein
MAPCDAGELISHLRHLGWCTFPWRLMPQDAPAVSLALSLHFCLLHHRFLAIMATFLVSGLWHELVFLFITGGSNSRGLWTAFFMAQVGTAQS